MVGVSASVNLPLHHKSRSSLLAPAHLGGTGKRAVKRLWCGDQSNLTQGHITTADRRFSHICWVAPMCTAHIQSQKMFSMATSLNCRVSAISAFCWPTTQTPITNSLVAIVHTKLVIAILVPKLVAMATSLRTSKSAMFSLDSLTQNPSIESNIVPLTMTQPKL